MSAAVNVAKACQNATASEHYPLLVAAYLVAHPQPDIVSAERGAWDRQALRFYELLDQEAFLSAAELLVLPGWRWKLYTLEDGRAGARLLLPGEIDPPSDLVKLSATPALALTAAALAVHAANQAGEPA